MTLTLINGELTAAERALEAEVLRDFAEAMRLCAARLPASSEWRSTLISVRPCVLEAANGMPVTAHNISAIASGNPRRDAAQGQERRGGPATRGSHPWTRTAP